MSNDIIIISTTEALTNRIDKVLADRALKVPVYEATMQRAYEIARESIENGTKVVICRGGTTSFLREKLDVPVVDIRHGFIDIYLSIKKAKEKSDKIAVIGFQNFCEAARTYREIMNEKITVEEVKDTEEIDAKLSKMIDEGIEVVVGGFQLSTVAAKYNVTFVHGDADDAAINLAIDEALHDLKIEYERERQYETINTILDSVSEGVVGIEKSGKILHINQIARELLNYRDNKDNITDMLPSVKLMDSAITSERRYTELLNVGNKSVVLNSVPIKLENETIGVVATIQEENYIQSMDTKIRKKHLGSGHVAKKTFSDIIGNSKAMTDTKERAKKYAKSDSTILITGETGTGKEIFAQSIHNYSKRKRNPFVAINCAALPENILESELFGYVKGAFTGAKDEGKAGIFELAHTGTVFLDEISEISTDVQVKLLRVIQEKEVARIGDDKIIPIDVRIFAASNKNLIEEINKGKFREDLYYRICVLELNLPPLRDRKEDIPELIDFFINERKEYEIKSITEEAVEVLSNFNWPGNIRQLSNVIEKLLVICEDGIIDRDSVEEALSHMRLMNKETDSWRKLCNKTYEAASTPQISLEDSELLDHMEMQMINDVLIKTKGNREKAAAILGISSTTLWRRMKKMKPLIGN